MMNMRFLLLLLTGVIVFSVGCIRSTSNVATPTGGATAAVVQDNFTIKDMREAIHYGCLEKNWKATDINANTIEATITVRNKHTVVVTIPYTATTYSINYKDSVNMNYKPHSDGTFSINRSYNNWVNNLDNAIRTNIAKKRPN